MISSVYFTLEESALQVFVCFAWNDSLLRRAITEKCGSMGRFEIYPPGGGGILVSRKKVDDDHLKNIFTRIIYPQRVTK